MYLVGEFANIVRVSNKTLKHYEKLELVVPQHINKDTRYRYYSDEQIQDVLLILELKRLGFALKEIKKILDNRNVSVLKTNFENRKKELEDNISQLIFLKNAIERKIEKLRGEETVCKTYPKYRVALKTFERIKAYSQRELINLDAIDDFIDKFYHQLKMNQMDSKGPLMVRFYHEDELLIGVADTELFIEIKEDNMSEIQNKNLKIIEPCFSASTFIECEESDIRYDAAIDETYEFLLGWIQEKNYKITGVPFEIIHKKSKKDDVNGISKFEICYPIMKK